MRTALIGKFDNGAMIEGSPAKIVAERCNDGLKEIMVSPSTEGSHNFSFQRNTRIRIHEPKTMDPFEKNTVYIKESGNSGDGLFARRIIERNEVVSYYSGTILKMEEMKQIQFYEFSFNKTGYER